MKKHEKFILFKVDTSRESKEIQEFLFSLGYSWRGDNNMEYFSVEIGAYILLCVDSNNIKSKNCIFYGNDKMQYDQELIKSYNMNNYKDSLCFIESFKLGLF